MSASHISTHQWQSFETRMRQRRVERCIVRAEAALETGYEAAAVDAIAEAKLLDPSVPDIDAIRATVEERRRAAAAAAAAEIAAVEGAVRRRRARQSVVAAGLGLALFGGSAAIMYRAAADSRLALLGGAPRPAAGISSAQTVDIPAASTVPAQPAPQPSAASPQQAVDSGPGASTAIQTVTRDFTVPSSASSAPPLALPAADTSQRRPDVPVQASEPVVTRFETPQVSSTPFASAPGDVASVPPPPAATLPPVEDRSAGAATAPVLEPAPNLPAAAPAPAPVDETARVRSVLSRFETAYSELNARAAQAVWPGVDGRSLARAFQGLEAQRLSLGQCALAIDGVTARAECDGSATWTPKIGGGTRTEARHWKFELQNTGGAWQIVTAASARTP
jgi:hypothetical protein